MRKGSVSGLIYPAIKKYPHTAGWGGTYVVYLNRLWRYPNLLKARFYFVLWISDEKIYQLSVNGQPQSCNYQSETDDYLVQKEVAIFKSASANWRIPIKKSLEEFSWRTSGKTEFLLSAWVSPYTPDFQYGSQCEYYRHLWFIFHMVSKHRLGPPVCSLAVKWYQPLVLTKKRNHLKDNKVTPWIPGNSRRTPCILKNWFTLTNCSKQQKLASFPASYTWSVGKIIINILHTIIPKKPVSWDKLIMRVNVIGQN